MSPEHRSPEDPQEWESEREALDAEQRRRFGGIKAGAAFFGWLTATGMSVLLTALLTAAGAGLALGTQTDPAKLAGGQTAPTVGIIGAAIVAVILFVSYYCGGYVAGRMARFDGARQGLAVWLWAVAIAILVAALAAAAGARFNVLSSLNSFPRIPVDEGTLTTGGTIVLITTALITLASAVLGGTAGMRYHRRIDHAEGL
ncbi:hypothetical protein SA2016_4114 (plasmid) [Sinomonas atrocyanea]|uniref:Uncharacterized protein n=1 Tax=Sinomonas atrocyanea TaxID=37927 RepID=A0A127A6R9_9MICC|nr:hypothetical protein [Sinomonas atrocyanea]AMM34766.1 hypothetical protein SA2016_4114 [Sinomonas atrocyanea]GEB66231.1 hypothetical protein SAT01_36790 [Sinomonas atrocyanea]